MRGKPTHDTDARRRPIVAQAVDSKSANGIGAPTQNSAIQRTTDSLACGTTFAGPAISAVAVPANSTAT